MINLCCCNCGIVFGVPDEWNKNRHDDKRDFYCPNGHQQAYVESNADRLRRERDRLQQQLAQKDDTIKLWRERTNAAERRVTTAKGQITRLKKRAKAGVCPCCNRTFTNMTEHMKTNHPDFDPTVVD